MCRTSKKDVLNTAMGECDRKPLIAFKGTPEGVSFFVWIFILLRELMSKAVDVEGVTYIISINYRALKHIFFSWIWYT